MKKIVYLLIVSFFVLLTGCRSSQVSTSGVVEKKEAKARYESFVSKSFDFTCLQSKLKFGLGGKNLNGKLSVEQGKRLCMTMTVLGAEVARVEADQECVYISEKLDKVYAKLSIKEMAAKLGMEDEACYEAFEALILGRIFIPGKGVASKGDFKQLEWSASDDNKLTGTYKGERYTLNYTLDSNNELSQTQVVVEEKGATFTWNYASRQLLEEKISLPAVEKLHASASDKDLTLQLSINNPQLSKKGWSTFKTDGYRMVSFEELLSMIKNLK